MAVVLVSAYFAGSAIKESLWLDEIHTSWVLWGSENTFFERAAQGNQTPLYFQLLRPFTRTLGIGEVALRLPSVVAFSISLGICVVMLLVGFREGRAASIASGALATASVVVWALLDRIQLFFATEARVYAICQLTTLLGWWILWRIAQHSIGGKKETSIEFASVAMHLFVWSLLAILSINLHLISGLAIAWQWMTICGLLFAVTLWQGSSIRMWIFFAAMTLVVLAGATLPNLDTAELVWGRRSQWESFGGDASWRKVTSLFPFSMILLPLTIAFVLDWVFGRVVKGSQERKRDSLFPVGRIRQLQTWVWAIAILGPLLTAWLLTAASITPILHRRYLLCVALPLVIFSAHCLMNLRFKVLQWSVLLASLLWMVNSQGTLGVWAKGELVGSQRPENWRGAASWVNRQISRSEDESTPGSSNQAKTPGLQDGAIPKVWIASGLIEAAAAEYPLTQAENAYLSFPLRGLYRVGTQHGTIIWPDALIGGWPEWTRQISESTTADQRVFVFFRGNLRAFQSAVEKMAESSTLEVVKPTRAFGSVCVAYLRDTQ